MEDHLWDLAIASYEISPELSRFYVQSMLETIKSDGQSVPPEFKRLFCFKCLTPFDAGVNSTMTLKSTKKHPNTKVLQIKCKHCGNKQNINYVRSHIQPVQETVQQKSNRRKLLMSILQ